jgi:7-carboxy-7-deazaguanine synthase
MKVTEVFHSLQGEGMLAGVSSVFIRLAGCPLRCRWCDTSYAWDHDSGSEYDVHSLLETVREWHCRHVVITGGEPFACPSLSQLSHSLKGLGVHITIETAGIGAMGDLSCDLMSISPKLSNSTPEEPHLAQLHEVCRLNVRALRELIHTYNHQLKFVVDSPDDLGEIEQVLADIGGVDPARVMLMPQAGTRSELLAKSPVVAEMCKNTGFAFCQRLHILLWDGRRGT